MTQSRTMHPVTPFRARTLYRLLYKRLRLPRDSVHRLLSSLKRIGHGERIREREGLAGELASGGPMALEQDRGFRLFGPDELPGAASAAEACRTLYERFRAEGRDKELLQRNPNKRFLLSTLSGDEFHAHPALVEFMVSPAIVDMASHYLGTVPVLEGAALWWTPPNDSKTSSQMWHIDELAPRQVKILLNCFDTGDEHGPLHLLPAAFSEKLRSEAGHRRGRLDDHWLETDQTRELTARATGPAGSGLIFDSSRCLHFGSRGNRLDRLVLAFHFLPFDAPTETRYRLTAPPTLATRTDLVRRQQLALGLA